MNKLIFKLFLLIIFVYNNSFSADELWRSRISGSWTTPSTWEYSTNSGGTWIIATSTFPEVTALATTITSGHNVSINAGIPLAIDQFSIQSNAELFINAGARLAISDGTGTDLTLESGASINGTGNIEATVGAQIVFLIRNNSYFNVPLVVDTGYTLTVYNDGGGNTAHFYNQLFISPGANFNVATGGYTATIHDRVFNEGMISGIGGASFRMNGDLFENDGSISVNNFNFDTTTLYTGSGTDWMSTSINLNSEGTLISGGNNIIKALSNINFNINSGGKLDYNGSGPFTFNSNGFSIGFTINSGGMVSSAVVVRSQSNVTFLVRNSSSFNGQLRVLNGQAIIYNDQTGNESNLFNGLTVDAGALFTNATGGYTTSVRGTVINNGTISGNGGASFRMKGGQFTSNGTVNVNHFFFDTTTTITSNNHTWNPANTYISSGGNLRLGNNLTINPTSSITFNILSGGILNPNSRIVTMDGTSGNISFVQNSSSTVTNSGSFETRGNVTMLVRNSNSFNAPLVVRNGQLTSYNDQVGNESRYFGGLTIDPGANFNVATGGYTSTFRGTVTNNGTISGAGGATYRMVGGIFNSNGLVTCSNFYFDSTTVINSTGQTWTPSNTYINSSGNLIAGTDVSFNPTSSVAFQVLSGGIINPNTHVLTMDGTSGPLSFVLNTSATSNNSGLFQTKGNITMYIRNSSLFNSPLRINTGQTTVLNDQSGNTFNFYNTVKVDTGSFFSIATGGYTGYLNDTLINNGTITGAGGAVMRFFGPVIENNGLVLINNFYFESIIFSPTSFHTLLGTGSFSSSNCQVFEGANVTLASDHQFYYLTLNAGCTFNINSRTLKLSGPGVPITANGSLVTAGSTIEYNGTAAQSLQQTNVSYANLRINNPAGAGLTDNISLPGLIQIISGNLNLNGRVLTLLTTATLSETPGNTVTGNSGYIVTTRNLNAPSSVNAGGLGAVITSSANLGLTEIKRGHTIQILSNGQSIRRYFAVKPVNNSGLNATFAFFYDESELNGLQESSLGLFKSTNAGSSYSFEGGTLNTNLNRIILNNVNTFARYTAGASFGILNITAAPEGFYNLSTLRLNSKDTITVKLRNKNSPYNVIDSARGVMDSVTLTTNLTFFSAPSDTYYVSINHRNSIETWSNTIGLIYNAGSTQNYNFTTEQIQAYGNNLTLKGTKWLMFGGDVNQNGNIDAADLSLVDNDAFNFVTGYVATDVTGNYVTDAADLSITDNNAFNFVSKKIPQ